MDRLCSWYLPGNKCLLTHWLCGNNSATKRGKNPLNPDCHFDGEEGNLLIFEIDRILLCTMGWPKTHYIAHDGLQCLLLQLTNAGITTGIRHISIWLISFELKINGFYLIVFLTEL